MLILSFNNEAQTRFIIQQGIFDNVNIANEMKNVRLTHFIIHLNRTRLAEMIEVEVLDQSGEDTGETFIIKKSHKLFNEFFWLFDGKAI